MILVDTSVLIDFLKGNQNPQTKKLRQIISNNIPFGITSLIMQEVLQGVKDESEFNKVEKYLTSLEFYHPKDQINSFTAAAKIYFDLRRKGVTIRSTIDCLIVQIALENNLALLHNDNDYKKIITFVHVNTV